MHETHRRLLDAATKHEISATQVAERIRCDSTTLTDLAEGMVSKFYGGTGCPMIVAETVIKLIADKNPAFKASNDILEIAQDHATAKGVRPPPEYAHLQEHHIKTPTGDILRVWWKRGAWWLEGGAGPILTEQLDARGWKYVAPASSLKSTGGVLTDGHARLAAALALGLTPDIVDSSIEPAPEGMVRTVYRVTVDRPSPTYAPTNVRAKSDMERDFQELVRNGWGVPSSVTVKVDLLSTNEQVAP